MTRDYIEISEQEFSLQRDGVTILRGRPDCVRVYHSRKKIAVMERKFGYKEVQAADGNLQLRAYLVLVARTYPADRYYGCLTQPRVSSKPQIVQYTLEEIFQAEDEIFAIYDACLSGTAQRRASNEACEHCSARTVCPEHKAWIGEIEKVRHLPVAQWTDEQMDIFETRRSAALKFIEDVHEQIKLIKAADPDRLPGWKLKPGNEIRTVTDLVKAWSALQTHMTAMEFSGECDVSITGLQRLVWQKHQDNPALGKLSQKAAKELINQILKDVLEKKRNKPSLEKDE